MFLTLGILAVFVELAMLYAWVSARLRYKKEKTPTYTPNTCVIVPCKGIEKNFIENVKAITNQDYKEYKVLFVTDSKDDPAYKTLKEMF
ncbi:MAG: glycosyltransferase family 2 protein, partial [Thermoplasmatales archaeon]|nr:glycosyltransferase family 2 protein [Thermoplasmatales archaeon]